MHAWASEPVVEELPDPAPGPGESLVAMAAAAVAHIDLTVAGGTFAHRPSLPYVPGTEGAGHVVRSDRHAVGAPVRVRGGGVGLTRDGTCAQLGAFPDEALTEVPAGTDLIVAATFFAPSLTAHAALTEVGGLAAGELVAVTGAAGAVGSMAVQLALRAGAEVVAVVRDAEKARALGEGVQCVLREREEDVAGAVLDAARRVRATGTGVDLLLDTVGGAELAALVTRAVRPGGRAVLVGYTAGESVTLDLPALLAADVRVLPMNLINRGPGLAATAADLLAAIGRGELTLARTRWPLESIGEALASVRDGTATGRVAVTIDGAGS